MSGVSKNEAFVAVDKDGHVARFTCAFTAEQSRQEAVNTLSYVGKNEAWADLKKRGWRIRKIRFEIIS